MHFHCKISQVDFFSLSCLRSHCFVKIETIRSNLLQILMTTSTCLPASLSTHTTFSFVTLEEQAESHPSTYTLDVISSCLLKGTTPGTLPSLSYIHIFISLLDFPISTQIKFYLSHLRNRLFLDFTSPLASPHSLFSLPNKTP